MELAERKRQDICLGCGKSIDDPEKECPRCGTFPHKAYHERAAIQTLGVSKWIQNSPTMQPNQKLSESGILKFSEYVETKKTKDI